VGSPTNFNALCNTHGSNQKSSLGAGLSCEFDLYYHTRTSQDYLEQYIEQEIPSCIDKDFIYDISKITIIPSSDPEVEILFGDNYTYILLDYPFTFIFPEGAPLNKIFNFASFKPIRYKLMYELAYYTAKRDIEDIFFNKSTINHVNKLQSCPRFRVDPATGDVQRTDYSVQCLYPEMDVKIQKEPCQDFCQDNKGKYADIVTINDTLSTINGHTYEFKFLVENRPPALDLIDENITATQQIYPYSQFLNYYYYLQNYHTTSPNELYNQTAYINTKLAQYQNTNQAIFNQLSASPPLGRGISADPRPNNYNIVVYPGQTITIKPYAIDPDEDAISYHYTGWRTPIQICNQSSEQASGQASPQSTECSEDTANPHFLSLNSPQAASYKDPHFIPPRTGVYTAGGIPTNEEGYENKNYWEESPDFLSTSKDVSYTAEHYDAGYHWLRLLIDDDEGLYDYQDITIQVRCDPTDLEHGGCCNMSNDYHPAVPGTKGTCKACYSCGATGLCVPDTNLHRDCGACGKCDLNAVGNPQCFEDDQDLSGGCKSKIIGLGGDVKDAACCGGSCLDTKTALPKPWITQSKQESCYKKDSILDSEGDGLPFCRINFQSGKKELTYPIDVKGSCTLVGDPGCARCSLGGSTKGLCIPSDSSAPNAFNPDVNLLSDQNEFYYERGSNTQQWINIQPTFTPLQKNFLGLCSAECSAGSCSSSGTASMTEEVTVLSSETSLPLPNAVIQLSDNLDVFIEQKTTNTRGVAVFNNLQAGTFKLSISTTGFDDKDNLLIKFFPGDTVKSNTFFLQRDCVPNCPLSCEPDCGNIDNLQASDLLVFLEFDTRRIAGVNTVALDDQSLNSNHAICQGTKCPFLLPTAGKFDGAYNFDGVDDFFINSQLVTGISTDMSLEVWVFLGADPIGQRGTLITLDSFISGQGTLAIFYNKATNGFEFYSNPGNDFLSAQSFPLDNRWHHVVATWDENTKEKVIYIDSIKKNSAFSQPFDITGDFIQIGAFELELASYWKGKLDDTRIWSKVLTEQEVKYLFNHKIELSDLQ
jgi:hypothetical protein